MPADPRDPVAAAEAVLVELHDQEWISNAIMDRVAEALTNLLADHKRLTEQRDAKLGDAGREIFLDLMSLWADQEAAENRDIIIRTKVYLQTMAAQLAAKDEELARKDRTITHWKEMEAELFAQLAALTAVPEDLAGLCEEAGEASKRLRGWRLIGPYDPQMTDNENADLIDQLAQALRSMNAALARRDRVDAEVRARIEALQASAHRLGFRRPDLEKVLAILDAKPTEPRSTDAVDLQRAVRDEDVEAVVNAIVRKSADYDGLHPYTSLSYEECCVLVRDAITAYLSRLTSTAATDAGVGNA